jgi:hypothetical protein
MPGSVLGGTNLIDPVDFEGSLERLKYDFWMSDGEFTVGIRMDTSS